MSGPWTDKDFAWLEATHNLIIAKERVRESQQRYRCMMILLPFQLAGVVLLLALFGMMLLMVYTPGIAK